MYLEVFISLIIIILSYWFYCFHYYYKHLKSVPSPKVWPIIGSALELGNPDESLKIIQMKMKELNSKTIRAHIGFRLFLFTTDYKMTEFLLNSQTIIDKGMEYDFFKGWLGNGLLTAKGERWRKQRKMITPTFHFQILEQFIDVFNSNGEILVKKLKEKIGNTSIDAFSLLSLYTLDIICETAMGTSINAQLEETSEYIKSISAIGEVLQERYSNPLYHADFIYKLTALYKKEKNALKVIHKYTHSVLQNKHEQLKQNLNSSQTDTQVDEFGRKKRIPFLDMLLQSTIDGKPLTDQEICDEVSTFMFGGHDTTATALSFALYSLANNPEVQQKAYEEIESIFGDDKERPCTYQDIQLMKYLELVIKETLRMYPPAPAIGRKAPTDIKYDNLVIPRTTTIAVDIYAMHHDADYFPDPYKFNPERFAPENYDGKRPFSFIPFSAGPRNCVGQKFANMEMKTTLSTILRNFVLKPATPKHELKLVAATVVKSLTGVKISLQERKS